MKKIVKRKYGPGTLKDHIAEMKADGTYFEHQRMIKEKLAEAERFRAEMAVAQMPIIEDLRTVGTLVDSVWDLVGARDASDLAVEGLVKQLDREYPKRVTEGIFRALIVPGSSLFWRRLAIAFDSLSSTGQSDLAFACGLALGEALIHSSDKDALNETLRIISEPKYGADRVALIPALVASKDPMIKNALKQFAADPEYGKRVRSAISLVKRKLL